MAKNLLQIFEKYTPSDEYDSELLLKAENIKLQANKESRVIQISANFPVLIKKERLYRIEKEIAKAYELKMAPTLIVNDGDKFEKYAGVQEIKAFINSL
jgi:hypothetical protein